jgi:hypothetical protein
VSEAFDYLARLEREAQQNHTEELYLWPRTPISNLQAETWRRVGVSDWRENDARSRPCRVLAAIADLLYNRLIPDRFSVLDICCGDALIPWHVKRSHPWSACAGVDLNKDRLAAHSMVQDQGVRLFRIPIQRLFADTEPVIFDVALMLNTYRGWESADLHDSERWLVSAANNWFWNHSRYTILTVSNGQIDKLREAGWWVNDIGPGEDDSRMILMWPCATGKLRELWQTKRG